MLYSILREDFIYSDLDSYRYSCHKQEGFYTYSEIFRMKFPLGYICDKGGRVSPSTARTVNLEQLSSILTSNNEDELRDQAWMWDGEFRFLDRSSIRNKKVGITSFPRSGNSFLRRYIEQITGVTTGSSFDIHASTSL